ncbi:cyclase family protein [Rhizohabitans arisaemae]|uniref:cyclase family protein n=1 Tax=Rhizohabitans arisaemae TaxID=2720610 RepID=UPI0024B0C36A|nr:cyclase family protein [Rhizohabitans arisaemae]
MPTIIDISWTINGDAPVYPGDAPPALREVASIEAGSPYALTQIERMSAHVLTHIDAPAHFIHGAPTLDDIPLSRFQGPAVVVDVAGDTVTAGDVPEGVSGKNVLFRTANSHIGEKEPYRETYVHVSAEAARLLVRRGVNLVGIDYLSVDAAVDDDFSTHRTLLGAGVLILEGLRLAHVPSGDYTLWAVPLKLANADGAPTRAVLVEG